MKDLIRLLDELDELEKQATPGEWEAQEPAFAPCIGFARIKGPRARRTLYGSAVFDSVADVELIASLRNNWPRISKALREAKNMADYYINRRYYSTEFDDDILGHTANLWLEEHGGGEK